MDFLRQIALPQSEAQIAVLHFVMNLITILLLPFISYLFGALILSLRFHRKGMQQNDANALQYSADVIDHLLPNKSILVLFGVVPYTALVFAYAQLLQNSSAVSVSIMTWGLLLFAAAAAFASSYHSAVKLGGVLASVPSKSDDVESMKSQMSETRRTSGKYALIFLTLSVYCLVAGMSLSARPELWMSIGSIVPLLFAPDVLLKLAQFTAVGLTIASLGMVFFTFHWQGGKKGITESYAAYVRRAALPLSLVLLLVQPLFVVGAVVLLPVSGLSGVVFTASFFTIFFIFLASLFVYGMIKDFMPRHSGNAFYLFVLSLMFVIVQSTSSLSTSTKQHSAMLAYQYTKYHNELLASMGISLATFSGEDIFNAKCSACHEFGIKKVGPAYKDVLPKYENDRAKLLSFVLNPQKIDPAYPPMPNQGLKPAEADSITSYIMQMYKQGQK